jgi:DinB superfamily
MRAASLPSIRHVVRCGALVALTLVCAPRAATGQAATIDAAAVRTTYLGELEELQSKFLQLAEAIPADKYSWRPGPGVRSIGEAFMHVATEYYLFSPMAYGAATSPVIGTGPQAYRKLEANPTKEEVLKHLKEGFAYTKQAVGGVSADSLANKRKWFGHDVSILETSFGMAGDLHEHLGQLIAYARVNGIKPPWSKGT